MAAWGQRTGETDYAPNSATDRVMRLCTELITTYHPLRTPMPLLALRAVTDQDAAEADAAVRKGVEFLRAMHLRRGLRCRVVRTDQDGDDFQRGLAVLRDLAGKPWDSTRRPHADTYGFPRSALLEAVEQAVAADDEDSVLVRLERMRWRPRPMGDGTGGWARQALRTALSPLHLAGAAVVAALGGLAAESPELMPFVLGAVVLVVVGGAWSRHHEGLLPWHGPAGRWLVTTTFLAVVGDFAPVWSIWRPRRSRETRANRVNEVAHVYQLAVGGPEGPERERARQFYLELRTLAFLDDLRHNFRPRPVLRMRRHVLPPMVFIPRATRENGGVVLLRVISDVRSRRSGLDPLFVVAGLTRQDEADLHIRTAVASPLTDPAGTPDPSALYRAWVHDHLRVGQSPSVAASLPWVLPIRLPDTLLTPSGTEAHDASPLGPPNWVRGAPRLLAGSVAVSLLTAGGVVAAAQPRSCHPEPLRLFDQDTEKVGSQCIGISDGTVPFDPDGGVRLNGRKYGRPGTGAGAAQFDVARLMRSIKNENDAVRDEPHVILYYAGELTHKKDPKTALNGLRELAGVHARQKYLNAGEDGTERKVVVEVANGGHLMEEQEKAVDRIIEHAREHPRQVLGVVGFSRDNKDTHSSVRRLAEEGLNVVAPQNSDDHLARDEKNFVSLAATNQEQARAFQKAIETGGVDVGKGEAVILTPSRAEQDIYSRQQAEAAEEALDRTEELTTRVVRYSDWDEVKEKLCEWKNVRALYFTGRAEKLGRLVEAVNGADCEVGPLALFTGDDVTKSIAMEGREQMPEGVTLYYASLAAPAHTFGSSSLPDHLAAVLEVRKVPHVTDPIFEDGTIALAYDATTVLYEAGAKADFRPEFINGELLKTKGRGAGGQIDLSWERHENPEGHTVAVFKVSRTAEPGEQPTCEAYYQGVGDDKTVGNVCDH